MHHVPPLAHWTSGDLSAAAAVGTLLVAVVAAIIGLYQLRQARKLREEEAAPYIVVDIKPSPIARVLLFLSIENTGATIAKNVRVTFSPELAQAMDTSGYPINNWLPIRDGIAALTPGRRVDAMFDESPIRAKSDLPTKYDVAIDCENAKGKAQPTVRYTIDLTATYSALYVEELTTHHLVKEARALNEKIEDIGRFGFPVRPHDDT